jgi:hypothetical protein
LSTGRLFKFCLFQCRACLFWHHICSASVSGFGVIQIYYQKRYVTSNLRTFTVCSMGTALLYLCIPFTMGKHITHLRVCTLLFTIAAVTVVLACDSRCKWMFSSKVVTKQQVIYYICIYYQFVLPILFITAAIILISN